MNKPSIQDLQDTYDNKNGQYKAKYGVRVIGDVNVYSLKNDLLTSIKKVENGIAALLPTAQALYNARYNGISLQDQDFTLPTLYNEIDDKLYILTTLNNTTNTQLITLDKEFDKLYNLVKNGLHRASLATQG